MVAASHPALVGHSIFATADLAEIAKIFDDGIAIVVYRRPLATALAAVVEELVVRDVGLPSKLVVSAGAKGHAALRAQLGFAPALADDIARWVDLVADLSDAPRIGVRLARVGEAMCPRFHVDYVLVRVVITYRGPGTELVAEQDLDRQFMSPNTNGRSDEDSGLLRRPGAVYCASAGDVVVLKGELWQGTAGRGAVHRSPSVDVPRLVLTLDPLE